MGALKKLLAVTLVIVLIIGGIYTAFNKKLLPSNLTASLPTFSLPTFQLPKQLSEIKTDEVLSNAQSQTNQLSERAVEVGQHAQQVLGAAVTVNESEEQRSLPEKAWEYGQYVYCKQVVESWEEKGLAK